MAREKRSKRSSTGTPLMFVGVKTKFTGSKRKKLSIASRRKQVAFMYLQGEPMGVIAEEMKLSEKTVQADLTWVRKEWQKDAKMLMDERKAQELAKLDRIEEQAWKGWLRSVSEQEVKTKRKRNVWMMLGRGKEMKRKRVPAEEVTEQVVRTSSGDPRFLEQIERCITLRLKVFGLLKGDNTNINQMFVDWGGLVGKGQMENPVEQEIKMIENQSHVQPGRQHIIDVQAEVKPAKKKPEELDKYRKKG